VIFPAPAACFSSAARRLHGVLSENSHYDRRIMQQAFCTSGALCLNLPDYSCARKTIHQRFFEFESNENETFLLSAYALKNEQEFFSA
jgi:hypothetical protein